MSESSSKLSAWIITVLASSAIAFLGSRFLLGLGDEDTDLYESPLMLSVARQLIAGPGELYGPFGGRNPLVLIHAPVYYRIAALAAWPIARAGLHPVAAARWAGRYLSALALAAMLAAAYVLARRDSGSRRAGWWAVLLIAAMPVLAGQPFTVRPDMLGLALQSWGVVLVLAALEHPATGGRRLVWAYTLFGLAVCVKQHLVAAGVVSTLLLLPAWFRGRLRGPTIARSLAVAVMVVAVIYGFEWIVTGGLIGNAAFVAASRVGRVHPGNWLHVGTLLTAVVGKSAGMVGLLTTAAVAVSGRWARAAGGLVVVSIAALSLAQLADSGPWVTGALAAATLLAILIAAPTAVPRDWRRRADRRIDAVLWLYVAAELIVVVVLSRASTGAWINYAIQAVVFIAVLTARALDRAIEEVGGGWLILSASVAVLGCALIDVKEVASRRRAERSDLARVFASTRAHPSIVYFADRPGLNRVHGRLDLVYDDWLYPVFESLRLAEPRARWLRPQIAAGPIRIVVIASERLHIDGIPESLPELGYRPAGRFGTFRVWLR